MKVTEPFRSLFRQGEGLNILSTGSKCPGNYTGLAKDAIMFLEDQCLVPRAKG